MTAISDSVVPAPSPARTVLGPLMFPFSSAKRLTKASNARKPLPHLIQIFNKPEKQGIHTNARLDRVANYRRSAPRIPFLSKLGPIPGELLLATTNQGSGTMEVSAQWPAGDLIAILFLQNPPDK